MSSRRKLGLCRRILIYAWWDEKTTRTCSFRFLEIPNIVTTPGKCEHTAFENTMRKRTERFLAPPRMCFSSGNALATTGMLDFDTAPALFARLATSAASAYACAPREGSGSSRAKMRWLGWDFGRTNLPTCSFARAGGPPRSSSVFLLYLANRDFDPRTSTNVWVGSPTP